MKILKLIAIVFLSASFALSCAKENPVFLESFSTNAESKLYKKEITAEDLATLSATNEVNEDVFNENHKYFYGFKRKLDNDHYLVSYVDTYTTKNSIAHAIKDSKSVYHCIYNKSNNLIVSKLRIQSTDPIYSYHTYKNGVYTIHSSIFRFIPEYSNDWQIRQKDDSSVSKYKIENNHFVQLN